MRNTAEMLQYMGTDAEKWAEEFCKIFPKGADQGTMIGWFANAMCASEEEQRNKDEENAIVTLGLLSSLLATRAGASDGNAPTWFPQPVEWLDLWRKASTIANADKEAPDYRELVGSLR